MALKVLNPDVHSDDTVRRLRDEARMLGLLRHRSVVQVDGLVQLGMNAIHPVQPSAMDINDLKARYGDRVCIVGNIDLDYTLPRGTEAEVEAEVKDRIERVGKGGGYMISSANSITDYCKVENVRAMAQAIRKYGTYPVAAPAPDGR